MSCAPLSAAKSDRLPQSGSLAQKNAHQPAAPRQNAGRLKKSCLPQEAIPEYPWPWGHESALIAVTAVGGSCQPALEASRHRACMTWLMRTFPGRLDTGMWFTPGEYQQAANAHHPVRFEKRTRRYGNVIIQARLAMLQAANLLDHEDGRYRPSFFNTNSRWAFTQAADRHLRHNAINAQRRFSERPLPLQEEAFVATPSFAVCVPCDSDTKYENAAQVPCGAPGRQSPSLYTEEARAKDPNHELQKDIFERVPTIDSEPGDDAESLDRDELLASLGITADEAATANTQVEDGWNAGNKSPSQAEWLAKSQQESVVSPGDSLTRSEAAMRDIEADKKATQDARNLLGRLHHQPLPAQSSYALIRMRGMMENAQKAYMAHPQATTASLVPFLKRYQTVERLVVAQRGQKAVKPDIERIKATFPLFGDLDIPAALRIKGTPEMWLYEAERVTQEASHGQLKRPVAVLAHRMKLWSERR